MDYFNRSSKIVKLVAQLQVALVISAVSILIIKEAGIFTFVAILGIYLLAGNIHHKVKELTDLTQKQNTVFPDTSKAEDVNFEVVDAVDAVDAVKQ